MTRETKIGLLVGLAFIIVIGILLSDHLSSTNEPLGAPLRVAGENLRSGLGQPGSDDVAPVLRAPQAITPASPVVINQELKQRSAPAPSPAVRFVEPVPTALATDRIRRAAQQQGEDVVPVDPNTQVSITPPPAAIDPQPTETIEPSKTIARTYQAKSGDSLGSIARKAYGSGSRANCDAIVAANPSLENNRDLIVAGRTYTIPALNGKPAPAAVTTDTDPAPTTHTQTYVVQPNDTLYSIAMLETGSSRGISAIKELNRDILNGSDRLRVNMKLKLPTKSAE